MSELPPSTQLPDGPPLFHQPDGTQIQIFVEAGGILQRPKLVRTLKKHGAAICSDPKNAHVVIVDPETWQGKEFIREWGNDQDKVVLNTSWVAKCISENKGLLAQDNWGNCLTRDDGLPILKPTVEGEEEAPTTGRLPTPRGTPVEVAIPRPKSSTSSHRPQKHIRKSSSSKPMSSGTPKPALTDNENANAPMSPTVFSESQSHPTPSISLTEPIIPFSQQPLQGAATLPIGMPNAGMAPFNMNMNMMMPFYPQMLAMFGAQQQNGGTVSAPPAPPNVPPQLQENFTTALMDIMRTYGAVPAMGQWPGMLPGMMPMQEPLNASGSGNGGAVRGRSSDANMTDARTLDLSPPRSPMLLQSSIKRKRKRPSMDRKSVDRKSVDRKVDREDAYDSINDLLGTDDDEEEPSLASLARKKKKKLEKQKQKEEADEAEVRNVNRKKESKRELEAHSPVPIRNPYQNQGQPLISSSTDASTGALFTNAEGDPLKFYVQVYSKDRQTVVKAIKRGGGHITSDMKLADYAVLYSHSADFNNLVNTAAGEHIPAVTSHFVHDALQRGSMPTDIENYLFKRKQSTQKEEERRLRKNAKAKERREQKALEKEYIAVPQTPNSPPPKQSSNTPSKSVSATPMPTPKTKTQVKDEKITEKKTKTPTRGLQAENVNASSSKASQKSAAMAQVGSNGYYPRDLTPTPPSEPKKGWERNRAGFLYTPAEKEWVEKYVFILYKRDPYLGLGACAKAVHKKLPHHTEGSWSMFLTGTFRDKFEEAKKRGGIAHRKEKSRWEDEQQRLKEENLARQRQNNATSPSLMDVDPPIQATSSTTIQADGKARRAQDLEDDIATVVRFFAFEGGDEGNEPEEEVWGKLTAKIQCKTAGTWDEFYTLHHEEVQRRYDLLLESTDN